jgi:hypothetical protein
LGIQELLGSIVRTRPEFRPDGIRSVDGSPVSWTVHVVSFDEDPIRRLAGRRELPYTGRIQVDIEIGGETYGIEFTAMSDGYVALAEVGEDLDRLRALHGKSHPSLVAAQQEAKAFYTEACSCFHSGK